MAKIEMHLTDGRVLDLSDLDVDAIFAVLRREHVTVEMIRETRHLLDANELPRYRCPRCGRVSYNRHDVAERYCGFCHLFEDDGPAMVEGRPR
jgi:ribosomal protein S27AE